jgi:anti-sigma B factor antagonist
MKIDARKQGDVTILEPSGKLLIGEGDVALREAVDAALADGARQLLVDLQKVTRMDSSGMAELIAAFNKVRERGGALKLLKLPPKIQNILGVTQLMTVFDIFEDEDEALASFD